MPSPENKPRRRRHRPVVHPKLDNPMEFQVGATLGDSPVLNVPTDSPAAPDPPREDVAAAASEEPTLSADIADTDLGRPVRRRRKKRRYRHLRWLWVALGVMAAIPIVLTGIGAITSPPHVAGVPTGHLIYLEADSPSDHTTTLRGLYVTGPGAAPRLLLHETEPQEVTDSGMREWITQPAVSPDGTQLAFEKQIITIQEEHQAIQNQIWVMPLSADGTQKPQLVMDLTRQKMKQIVGLAWDSDSSVLFLEDGISYSVPTNGADAPLQTSLNLNGLSLATTADISATRSPALTESGSFTYAVQTPTGPQVLVQSQDTVKSGPPSAIYALSPQGDKIAYVPPGTNATIRLFDIASGQPGQELKVRWGWSVFGRRQITSLRWSPDGAQIAFTVSKPPVPDDEIFLVDIASGNTTQLPYRTGRAAWDWSQ